MNKVAFELYYYMGSVKPVVEWLRLEGVKTQKQAVKKLDDFLKKNPIEMDVMIKKLIVSDKQLYDPYSGTFFSKIIENFTEDNSPKYKGTKTPSHASATKD